MKQINILKFLLFVSCLGTFNVAMGQIHPLAFGPHSIAGSTTLSGSNWYKDYVPFRVTVTSPSVIAGDKVNKTATVGTGTSEWPDMIYTDIINTPIVMDTTADSFGGTAFPAGYFAGKIAVLWRGPISSPYTFTLKAKNAQDAGAVALVLINEYPGAGPIGPGYTTGVGAITIPVVMIGNADGIALSAQYHTTPAGTCKMSLTFWGQGYASDLGFVPNGQAQWHNYALPYEQFAAGNTSNAYKGLNGSFIANFGTTAASNVKVSGTLNFVPGGTGTPTLVHSDTVTFAGPFNPIDSIYSMFNGNEYNMTASGPGRFDLTYNLTSSLTDQYPGDNSVTTSFYLTDSLFSKGRYDFVNKVPIRGSYLGFANGAEITWGPMYYVAKGGRALSKVQYSIANNSTANPNPLIGSNDVLIFKYTDASNDSILQNGELELVSMSTKTYDGLLDTSEATLSLTTFNDSANLNPKTVLLDSGSWYLVAIDLTGSSTSTPLFLGVDGTNSQYQRVYGRWLINPSNLEYSSIADGSLSDIQSNPTTNHSPFPFTQVSFVNVVDSFTYSQMRGLIPAVAITTKDTTGTIIPIDHTGVQNTKKPFGTFNVFPNPASDFINVTADLVTPAKTVTYRIMDAQARVIGKETHSNVSSEEFRINTSLLAPGNYYLLISADGRTTSKKFTVIK